MTSNLITPNTSEDPRIDPEKRKGRINITRTLPKPNQYTLALDGEYRDWAFNEERAPHNKGLWGASIFKNENPIDLEIGTGAGNFFDHQARTTSNRNLVGVEIKYKQIIQTIRRARMSGCQNAAIIRYHAFELSDIFADGEIENIYIHFPDPWTSPKKPKNRLVQEKNLKFLHQLQKPGSFIEFKTDSRVYFDWALEEIEKSPYEIEFCTFDLHQSEKASLNFQTAFEKIFLRQQIPINYVLLRKK